MQRVLFWNYYLKFEMHKSLKIRHRSTLIKTMSTETLNVVNFITKKYKPV